MPVPSSFLYLNINLEYLWMKMTSSLSCKHITFIIGFTIHLFFYNTAKVRLSQLTPPSFISNISCLQYVQGKMADSGVIIILFIS
jgi:hypothetical protein